MIKLKRFLAVTSIALTLFSFGIGYLCLRTFTLLGWLILSLQIEFGIIIFALTVIGIILVYCWVDYEKSVKEEMEKAKKEKELAETIVEIIK